MPPAVRQYNWLMRILSLIYLLVAVLVSYLTFNGATLPSFANVVPALTEPPKILFWCVLSMTLMICMTLTALWSSFYPKVKGFFIIHFLSLFIPCLAFGFLFWKHGKLGIFFLGSLATGLPSIFLLLFYLRTCFAKEVPPAVAQL